MSGSAAERLNIIDTIDFLIFFIGMLYREC